MLLTRCTTVFSQIPRLHREHLGWIQGRYNGGFMEELPRVHNYPPIELSIPSKNRPLKATFSDLMNKMFQQKLLLFALLQIIFLQSLILTILHPHLR